MQKSQDPSIRLRTSPLKAPFHIVLVEPEIPPNTGNIARLCAATCSSLHLVGPLGFRIDAQSVRRAGVDYWHLVDIQQHDTFSGFAEEFFKKSPSNHLYFFSAHARKSFLEPTYHPGDALVFGKESVGLPQSLLEAYPDQVVGIPTSGQVRSLNLANAVSIALFESIRQVGGLASVFRG